MARMHESEKHVNVEVWNCWEIVILGLFPVEMLLRIQMHETMIWEIKIIVHCGLLTEWSDMSDKSRFSNHTILSKNDRLF